MAEQMYLEFPLKPEYVEDFFELCNSELGFALTKKQPGFISAEWMISTSKNGIPYYDGPNRRGFVRYSRNQ